MFHSLAVAVCKPAEEYIKLVPVEDTLKVPPYNVGEVGIPDTSNVPLAGIINTPAPKVFTPVPLNFRCA